MTIKVALVNDYEVVVKGLAEMLRAYSHVVRVVELDANTDVGERVDVALYDTFAQAQGTSPAVRRLAENPRVGKVVVYSWNTDPDLVRHSIANGASAYVSKAVPAAELVAALRAVHLGRPIGLPEPVRGHGAGGDWPGREEGLTPRESEVLCLITQGLSNADIVQRSGLSINSIKSYIRTAYRKIGATSRSQAVLWGVEHGMRPDRVRLTPPNPGP